MNTIDDVRKALLKTGCKQLPKGTKACFPWEPEKTIDLVEEMREAAEKVKKGHLKSGRT